MRFANIKRECTDNKKWPKYIDIVKFLNFLASE